MQGRKPIATDRRSVVHGPSHGTGQQLPGNRDIQALRTGRIPGMSVGVVGVADMQSSARNSSTVSAVPVSTVPVSAVPVSAVPVSTVVALTQAWRSIRTDSAVAVAASARVGQIRRTQLRAMLTAAIGLTGLDAATSRGSADRTAALVCELMTALTSTSRGSTDGEFLRRQGMTVRRRFVTWFADSARFRPFHRWLRRT